MGASYGRALQAALGARYYSNALAQEKTGEMWVDGKLYGGPTKGDFEHAEVVVFLGKNPWQSHSFPRARPTLRDIAKDPNRAMIVIDVAFTETARHADYVLPAASQFEKWEATFFNVEFPRNTFHLRSRSLVNRGATASSGIARYQGNMATR